MRMHFTEIRGKSKKIKVNVVCLLSRKRFQANKCSQKNLSPTLKMMANEGMKLHHLKAQQEIDIMMNDIKERNEKISSSAKEIDAELDEIDSLFDELNS